MTGSREYNGLQSQETDKALRLTEYLRRLATLRTTLIRDINNYERRLWLSDVPRDRGCFTQAWRRDEEHQPDEWLEVQNRREPERPVVPAQCKDWAESSSLRNKDDLPELLPEIAQQFPNPEWREGSDEPETIPRTEYLEDHPKVQQAWEQYVETKWWPWKEEHDAWEKVHKVYSELFAIHQEQLRLGEEYELVLGLGLLTWKTPTGQRVRRHLIVADAILEFEARLGRFTVSPHTEGAKLRPELDMLDIEEQPARAEETAKGALAAAEDGPWDKGCVEGVLKALVHSINSQGDYDESLEAKSIPVSDKPIVEYAPALILRKRSSKGLTESLKLIKEQIENGEAIPGEFADLAEIRRKDDRDPSDEPEEATAAFDGEVFFPKPSNDEQRRIVDKIRAASGVLVQGPPGTGKSHTIANLICHLLATGNRILITAKTPRALQVLEELVPDELRTLCINLLGSGQDERRSLEASVGGILRKNDEWNEDSARQDIEVLEERLRRLREESAELNHRLRAIRESETHTQSIAEGAYRGTAARIAEAVNRDRADYGWFTDSVPLDTTCPIPVDELGNDLATLREFTPEKRRELDLDWPEALPSPAHVDSLLREEARRTEQERILAEGVDERIAEYLSTKESRSIRELRECISVFHYERERLLALQEPWIQEAVRDVLEGDNSLWIEFAHLPNDKSDLRHLLEHLRRYTPEKRQELKLDLPDKLPSTEDTVRLFDTEERIAEEERLCLFDGADERIADNYFRSNAPLGGIQALHDSLSVFKEYLQKMNSASNPWVIDAIQDIAAGNYEVWRERYRATIQAIESIEGSVAIADQTLLTFPDSISVTTLSKHVLKLKQYMHNGGKLSWRPFRPKALNDSLRLLKQVQVDGHRCANLDDLSLVASVLQLRLELDKAWKAWSSLACRTPGTHQVEVASLKSLCRTLLAAKDNTEKCRESVKRFPCISEPVWHDVNEISKLIASSRLVQVRQRKQVTGDALKGLESSAVDWANAPCSHPITNELLDAIRNRGFEDFTRCASCVENLQRESQEVERLDREISEMAYYAPRLAEELKRTNNDPIWDERMCCIGSPVLVQILKLTDRIQSCRDKLPEMRGISLSNRSETERYIAACSLALARYERNETAQRIRELELKVSIIDTKNKAHPLTFELRQAICDRNLDEYEKVASMIADLEEQRQRLNGLDECLSRLRRLLPQFTQSLEQSCNEPYWEERIERISDAWRWAQARYWIEDYIREEDVPALAKRSKQVEDDINRIIAKLASLYAWSFCFSPDSPRRIEDHHRRHMEAWQQSMRRLGKGRGKHAPRHRREAQGHLNECREAVPAWVMPLHRVWDTVYPAPGMFDVIIVDEASQCGVEALPLFYLGKKILIVGDDKQISPEAGFVDKNVVFQLMEQLLHDFEHKDSFHRDASLFDHGKLRYGTRRITLREHFRCMPEIIRFSNDLCYSDTPLIPLRQYGPNRLPPLEHVFLRGGYREGSGKRAINRPEAEAIVERIAEICGDSLYDGRTMGVVVLQGEAQAQLIENQILERLGAEEMERRRLVCGNPYSFQGDERDIMFLSLVAASNERIGPLTKAADEQRFNVAASRARDMMILFHSVTSDGLSEKDLRRQLLEFFQNTEPQQIAGIDRDELERRAAQDNRRVVNPPAPFESWFEVDVALELLRKKYTVLPQYEVAKKRIDLVVEGGPVRLAVECDGDYWHGADRYEADMQRQRQLERCGWEFFRIRESAFYANNENALAGLWQVLEDRDILPASMRSIEQEEDITTAEDGETECDEDQIEGDEPVGPPTSTDAVDSDSDDNGDSRQPDDVTAKEIKNAIMSVLQDLPKQSCTEKSLTKRVLKEVGVLTRGKPREDFEKRVMRGVRDLGKRDVVEQYRAKNKRIRLLSSDDSVAEEDTQQADLFS